jgi:hypothetical protein
MFFRTPIQYIHTHIKNIFKEHFPIIKRNGEHGKYSKVKKEKRAKRFT